MTNRYPRIPPLQRRQLTVEIPDISTADQRFVALGFDGKITRITSVLGGPISGADATLTAKINGNAIGGGAITVEATGSAAGDVDFAEPTGDARFTQDDAVEIETDGASTNAAPVSITLEAEPG